MISFPLRREPDVGTRSGRRTREQSIVSRLWLGQGRWKSAGLTSKTSPPHIVEAKKILDSVDTFAQCCITRLAVVTYAPNGNKSDIALIVARASAAARGHTLMVSERRQEYAGDFKIPHQGHSWVQDVECDGLSYSDHTGFISDYDVGTLYSRGIRAVIIDIHVHQPIQPWILRELSDFPMIINVKLREISQFDLVRLVDQVLPQNASIMGIVAER